MKIYDIFFASNGYKRTIASIFATAAMIAQSVPQLNPYANILNTLAGIFGAAGIAHPLLKGN